VRGYRVALVAFVVGFVGFLLLNFATPLGTDVLADVLVTQLVLDIIAVVYLVVRFRQSGAFATWTGSTAVTAAAIVALGILPIVATVIDPNGLPQDERSAVRMFGLVLVGAAPVFAALVVFLNDFFGEG